MPESNAIELPVVDVANKEVARVALPSAFCGRVSDPVMFEQVLSQRASRRRGTAATKTRGFVRGGGKKPWRQKGTGNARAGSSRSPIWRGGAVIFGPQPRSYAYRLPRSARRAALRSALSQKGRDGQIRVVDRLALEAPKTKQLRSILDTLGIRGSALIVLPKRDSAVELSGRNLPGITVLSIEGVNVEDVLRHELLVVVRDAIEGLEARAVS